MCWKCTPSGQYNSFLSKELKKKTLYARFTYPEDGSVMLEMGVERQGSKKVTQTSIKKDATNLLRTLLDHTKGLPPLPDNCHITVDLTYYDELVPADYQPEGFKESAIFQLPNGKRG